MNIKEWVQEHPKGVTFKCDCGATVNLQIWVEDFRVCMYARCWKCNKEMERQETTILIDLAKFDIVDHMIKWSCGFLLCVYGRIRCLKRGLIFFLQHLWA